MNDMEMSVESARLMDMILSDDPAMHKEAAVDMTETLRTHNREGSWTSKIIEPIPFDRSMLQKQMHTDQPVILFEYEMSSPGAVPVDYGTTPMDFIPKGRRFPVHLQRVQTRNVVWDVMELQTYGQDVRRIMMDNMTKDLIARRDVKFLSACRKVLGPVNTALPWCGKPMHVASNSTLTHTAFVRGKNTMRDTEFAIEPSKVLMNHLRMTDFDVMAVEELQGTDKSVDVAFKGFSEAEYSGLQLMFTIRRRLVAREETFWFGDQSYLGRYVQWVAPTMSLKKEDTFVQAYQYEYFGITIAHPGALALNRYL